MSAAKMCGCRSLVRPIGAGVALVVAATATAAVPQDAAAPCVLSEKLIDDLATGAMLYRRGLEQRDPVLLVVAARLRMPVEAACAGLPGIGSVAMLADADALSSGSAVDATLVAQTRALQPRGSSTGLSAQAALIAPRSTYRLKRLFRPRESAVVYAEGAPETEISLTVDGVATRLCLGRGPRGQQLCRFVPDRPETADIVVTNLGGRAARVLLVTN